jgi:thiamine biosynthesis lipoprotein
MNQREIARDAVRAAIAQGTALPAAVSDRREIMGGRGTITVVGAGASVLDEAWALAHELERLWTRFDSASDVQRLNWAEGRPTEVDVFTVRLIDELKKANALSNGDFDPTLLPSLISLGYAASVANPKRVTTLPESARAPGNVSGIVTSGTTVTMPHGTSIDAGGMGKGLAGDLVCSRALDLGAYGVMAEFLGDIVVAGAAPDGVAWRLGIEDPFDNAKELAQVRISHGAIVTSSQRKRRFGPADAHHLLSPADGSSAQTDVQTATVIAGTGAHAEALSKSAFVRHPDAFLEWLPTQSAAGMVVLEDGHIRTSANWGTYR